MWIILTKKSNIAQFAKNRGSKIFKTDSGYIIVPPTNSEAHRIYNKFSWDCKIIDTRKILPCEVCKHFSGCNDIWVDWELQKHITNGCDNFDFD